MRLDAYGQRAVGELVTVLEARAVEPRRKPCPCGCLVEHPTCCRCEELAARSEKHGDPSPPIELVETWIGHNGQRYFAGLCRECADVEWSIRWDLHFAKADQDQKTLLLKVVQERELSGRQYLGSKRPGGPSTKAHAPTCRCQECRARAVAAAQADAGDRSLWPQGFEPKAVRP